MKSLRFDFSPFVHTISQPFQNHFTRHLRKRARRVIRPAAQQRLGSGSVSIPRRSGQFHRLAFTRGVQCTLAVEGRAGPDAYCLLLCPHISIAEILFFHLKLFGCNPFYTP